MTLCVFVCGCGRLVGCALTQAPPLEGDDITDFRALNEPSVLMGVMCRYLGASTTPLLPSLCLRYGRAGRGGRWCVDVLSGWRRRDVGVLLCAAVVPPRS